MSVAKSHNPKSFRMPGGAWSRNAFFDLGFPDKWKIIECKMVDAPPISTHDIRIAFENPIGSKSLKFSGKGKNRAVVAVEDISRPTILQPVLKRLIVELKGAGLEKEDITFLICNGAHPPMLRKDILMKLGKDILKDYRVINHNPYDNLIETDVVQGNTRLKINRYYFTADLRIAVGSIIPHSMAGFSSGAKLILPGLSDIATLERTHKFAMMGFRGGVNDVEENKFRQDLESAASGIGMDFFVGVVPNSRQEIAGVFTGDMVAAHRAGVNFARNIYETKVTSSCDILILNAYPKDSDLFQAETAFTPLRASDKEFVRKEGIVVIVSRCSNGLGHHSLFGPGMRLYRKPIQRSLLKGRDLIFFSSNIQQAEFNTMFWSGYKFVNKWASLLSLLKERFQGVREVMVFPCAPLQLVKCVF
ncbi:MAG: DUF2088 domain-containing protein [Desulfobacterales bacterium]|nr:MAG: DUF2088 domain-containing protein [Desulfobacterales bacterium]